MEPEDITLSEISQAQAQKDKHYVLTCTQKLKTLIS
jgi:hypothetical protein